MTSITHDRGLIWAQCGSILGLYLNGWISEIIGYKKTMIASLLVMIGFLFIPFFSPSVEIFVVGAVLQGIPWFVTNSQRVLHANDNTQGHLPNLDRYICLGSLPCQTATNTHNLWSVFF